MRFYYIGLNAAKSELIRPRFFLGLNGVPSWHRLSGFQSDLQCIHCRTFESFSNVNLQYESAEKDFSFLRNSWRLRSCTANKSYWKIYFYDSIKKLFFGSIWPILLLLLSQQGLCRIHALVLVCWLRLLLLEFLSWCLICPSVGDLLDT